MPNWVEGNIRFRGACKNIKALLENELQCVGHVPGKITEIISDKPVVSVEYGGLVVARPDGGQNVIFPAFYIKGTRRNYLDGVSSIEAYGCYDEDDERQVVTFVFDSFKAAWGIDAAPYLKIAIQYDVDIHIFGWEKGMEFTQEIEIVNGEILKDVEGKYDDWEWECPLPYMGG